MAESTIDAAALGARFGGVVSDLTVAAEDPSP